MSRPICFHCGRQLMYVNGKPVFTIYIDPIGAEHKLHKACARDEGYVKKPIPIPHVRAKSHD